MDIWQNSIGKVLEDNERNADFYQNLIKAHQELKDNLKTYNESLEIPILVPICSRVLMKGSLIHTNEILVSIGSNYFVKNSSKQAQDLCDRRIANSENVLKELEKERQFLTNQVEFSKDNILLPEGEEIIEQYDEEAEKEWREKRRSKVAASRREEIKKYDEIDDQELLDKLDMLELKEDMENMKDDDDEEENQTIDKKSLYENVQDEILTIKKKLKALKSVKRVKCNTEDDVFKRLDQLEEEEELTERLERLRENLSDDESDTESYSSSEDDKVIEHVEIINQYKKDNPELDNDSKEIKSKDKTEVNKCNGKKKVLFKNILEEEPEPSILTINFKHSDNPGVVKQQSDTLESPSDIYNIFPYHKNPKKSIIKNCHKVKEETHSINEYVEGKEVLKESVSINVIGEIVERDKIDLNITEEPKVQKPVSKFKSMRMSKKGK